MPSRPRFSEEQLREAIAISFNWSEVARRLGRCPTGGGAATLKKYAEAWGIPTVHFDPDLARHRGLKGESIPLDEVLVEGSTFSRVQLKNRLYKEGLKQRFCELCGQGETWLGLPMGLILDHINGVRNDNRLENLQIVCPNCAATLPTHCGRALRRPKPTIGCARCGKKVVRKHRTQRYCSRECGQRNAGARLRRVERPSYEQLMREIAESSYLAVGRKYGVSDNAIRKWVRAYGREKRRNGEDSA